MFNLIARDAYIILIFVFFIYVSDFGLAHTFVKNRRVYEGDNIDLRCAVFEVSRQKTLHLYLCKNGIGVFMEVTQRMEADFTLRRVRSKESGNYSCVYSIYKYNIGSVRSINEDSIIVQVIANRSNLGKHMMCYILIKLMFQELYEGADVTSCVSIEMDSPVTHRWRVNSIRLLCSAGVVIATVIVLVRLYLSGKMSFNICGFP